MRILMLTVFLIVTSISVQASSYPWPDAEYPSREKSMRRDLSEPLEFGAKLPSPYGGQAPSAPVTKRVAVPQKPRAVRSSPSVARLTPTKPPIPEPSPFRVAGDSVVDVPEGAPPDAVLLTTEPVEDAAEEIVHLLIYAALAALLAGFVAYLIARRFDRSSTEKKGFMDDRETSTPDA